ncbi:MAG: SMI1/KNR4 family protein [Planctomycetia bacterium]|nr:SMI1/KNR4 family protein [Planctomycetia bacterium]
MYKIDRFTVEHWMQEVFKLNQEYYDLIRAGIKQRLNPPAKESEIAAFEKWLGQQLPPSYRIFLSLHNGWQHWEGDTHLISIEQHQRGKYAEWIEKLKKEAWEEGNSAAIDGIFIGVQLDSVGGYILDTSKVDDKGEMEIINLEYSEVARYSDFIDLLQQTAEDLKGLIEDEKESKEK